jgi:hypothetical protein
MGVCIVVAVSDVVVASPDVVVAAFEVAVAGPCAVVVVDSLEGTNEAGMWNVVVVATVAMGSVVATVAMGVVVPTVAMGVVTYELPMLALVPNPKPTTVMASRQRKEVVARRAWPAFMAAPFPSA